MAAVYMLRRPVQDDAPPVSANVVRLVEVLGPISPELVLVDPELARRARALLPEIPARLVPLAEPFAVVRLPSTARRERPRVRRLGAGAALAAAACLAAVGGARMGDPSDGASRTPALRVSAASTQPPAVTRQPVRPVSSSKTALAPPRFVWPAASRVTGYRVALYREGRQIFERDVFVPALQLPESWSYAGRTFTFTSGTYRWVVWPLTGSGSEVTPGRAIVSADYDA
jgi:hypothetical protein